MFVGDPWTSLDPWTEVRGPRTQSPFFGKEQARRYRFFFAFALLVFFAIAIIRRAPGVLERAFCVVPALTWK
jgi:hypothetical protein